MARDILDSTQETDRDRRIAHVAVFCALACAEGQSPGTTQPREFVSGSDETVLDRDHLLERLASLPKPLWIDGSFRSGQLEVRTGPLKDRPDIQSRYNRWHEPKEAPPRYPPPVDDATVLLSTEALGLRVRWGDFVQYQRDYFPTTFFSYGMSDVGGISPHLRRFSRTELTGIARIISVMRPGPVLMFDERNE